MPTTIYVLNRHTSFQTDFIGVAEQRITLIEIVCNARTRQIFVCITDFCYVCCLYFSK